MKHNTKAKGLFASALALTVGVTTLAAGGALTASAAESGYGDNLVAYGDFTEYGSSLKPAGSYAAGDTVPIPYVEYEGRYHDVYCRKAIPGGSGLFVKTEDNAYINLRWDGEATGDSIEFWVQPGKLPVGNYTVEMNVDIVGFSTGDCAIFNFNGEAKAAYFNAEEYEACPDSEAEGLKKVSYEVTIGEDTDYPATHIWFYHKFSKAIQLHLYDITYRNEQGEVIYFNDFTGPFDDGWKLTDAEIGKDGDNVAVQIGTNGSAEIPVTLDGVGLYRVQFDVKPNSDYAGEFYAAFLATQSTFEVWRQVATAKSDFDFLDDAEAEGWVHYSGTMLVDNLRENNILSLALTHSGEGSLAIDNVVLEKKLDSVVKRETPSTEGLEFKDIVLGGDFEGFEEGYKLVSEPQADDNFWGSVALDSPAKVVTMNGNKVLRIAFDPNDPDKQTNQWASAFVFLDSSKFNTDDIFTLSYKYKYEEKEGFDPTVGLQVAFVGGTGATHYVQYLNYIDVLHETSDVNTDEWPFTVTDLQDGWKQVTLTFKMNTAFISQVDSIRFLNYNNCQGEAVLYVDDVKYGVWQTPSATTPGTDNPGTETPGTQTPGTDNPGTTETPGTTEETKKGCGSSIGALSVTLGLAAVLTVAVGFVAVKTKKEKQ